MSEYKPNSWLTECVQKGDPFDVIGAIIGIILSPTGDTRSEVYQAIQYAEDNGVKLFAETFDAELPINTNRAEWTEEYRAKALNYLWENFERSRLEHVLEVDRHVFPPQKSAGEARPKAAPEQRDAAPKQVQEKGGAGPKKSNGHLNLILLAAGVTVVVAVAILLLK